MGARKKPKSALQLAFEASGLTLAQFAEKVGTTPSVAHGWIHGTHGIRQKWFRPIAAALAMDAGELV